MTYALIDSGFGEKLEEFGAYRLIRPSAQAVWPPALGKSFWNQASARFIRKENSNEWIKKKEFPEAWHVQIEGIVFGLLPTDFGHLGVFPEHASQWQFIQDILHSVKEEVEILNLFAYTGGATLAAAKAGAKVCHLDASKTSVAHARDNAKLNHLEKHPIRWIIEDALKFLRRESKRGKKYRGIILDPPSFGRGKLGEVFKIERDLGEILDLCKELLHEPLFIVFTSHTPGFTPLVMRNLLYTMMETFQGKIEEGELFIPSKSGLPLPAGSFARWSNGC